ncbi:MAG: hypothetical protein R3C04_11465 [Hyphomonas sp.]
MTAAAELTNTKTIALEVIVKEGIDEKTNAAAKALESENYSAGFSTEDRDGVLRRRACRKTRSASSRPRRKSRSGLPDWRLAAYKRWLTMEEPTWAKVRYSPINYQEYLLATPRNRRNMSRLDDVPKEIL